MNRSKQRKQLRDIMAIPILHLNGNISQDEANKIGKLIIESCNTHKIPIITTAPDVQMEYVRYVSPKRMRLLVYGRLKH